MVFCDISKAFDKVWHAGLSFKLKKMGITEKLLAWISNYLCDRKQRVVLQGESSCWADINAGAPQGSAPGPLLFLVYINDMEEGLTSKLTLFADDNLLLSISNCHIINSQILNRDLKKLEAWAQQWIVSFSALKTNSMVVIVEILLPQITSRCITKNYKISLLQTFRCYPSTKFKMGQTL